MRHDAGSSIHGGLAGGAGVVGAPSLEAVVKHLQMVALSPDQALVGIVFEGSGV
jgi:transcriptional regulator of heat shock response